MAITENPLLANGSTTDATSYTTASFTPTSGSDQVLIVTFCQAFGSAHFPTVSGWTEIGRTAAFNGSDGVIAFKKHTSGSQTAVIDFGSNTESGCRWQIFEFAGLNVTNPFIHVVSATGNSSSPAVTMSAFYSTANGACCAIGGSINTTTTEQSGWTEIYDEGQSEAFADMCLETQWRADNDPTPDAKGTFGGSNNWGILAFELNTLVISGRRLVNGGLVNLGLVNGGLGR